MLPDISKKSKEGPAISLTVDVRDHTMSYDRTDTLIKGSAAPDFCLRSASTSEEYCLKALVKEGPLVIEILRGTWCHNCQKRMLEIERHRDDLADLGGILVYIAAEKRDGIFKPSEFLKKHPISFPFLLDEDRSVIKRYGLFHRVGSDALNIAHPATVLVDLAGTVRFIYRGTGQADRVSFLAVLSVLKTMQNSA